MSLSDQRVDRRSFHFDICLGRGGFGEVYLANMTSAGGLKSQVAVKVLLESVDPRSQAVQRLRDEARLLATLRHPSIPQVHDLVLLNGRVGLVVEYIEGADLEACIVGDHPISPRALVESIGQIADALDEAYTSYGPDGEPLHLVHRDVKPANIRLGRRGSVKLLDFGIAHAKLSNREAKTQQNAVIGSFPYMAPERFSEKGTMDPRGDVFSLGCVMYEGITGQRLFGELEAMEIWGLVMDDDAHRQWVEDRLAALHQLDPRVLALLRETLAYEMDRRLTAPQLVARCEELAPQLPGANLRSWARNHNWPEPSDHGGPLAGQTVMESAFSLQRSMETMREEAGSLPSPADKAVEPAAPRASWTTYQDTSATGEVPVPPCRTSRSRRPSALMSTKVGAHC